MRIRVAVEPLFVVHKYVSHEDRRRIGRGKTYKAANPRIEATSTLVCLFICRFLTIRIGKSPKIQSAPEFRAEMV